MCAQSKKKKKKKKKKNTFAHMSKFTHVCKFVHVKEAFDFISISYTDISVTV